MTILTEILGFSREYSSIIVPLILFVQVIYVTKIKSTDGKMIISLDKKNMEEHSLVFKKLNDLFLDITKITSYLDLDKQNKDFIKIMNDVKDYYCDMFINPDLKEFAILRSKQFIFLINGIIESYDLQISSLKPIKDSLYAAFSSVKRDMLSCFDNAVVEQYYQETHNKELEMYIALAEDIITDVENHHKERFLKIANRYLKESLKNLKQYEDAFVLKEKTNGDEL